MHDEYERISPGVMILDTMTCSLGELQWYVKITSVGGTGLVTACRPTEWLNGNTAAIKMIMGQAGAQDSWRSKLHSVEAIGSAIMVFAILLILQARVLNVLNINILCVLCPSHLPRCTCEKRTFLNRAFCSLNPCLYNVSSCRSWPTTLNLLQVVLFLQAQASL